MSSSNYGGFILRVSEDVILKTIPFEFGVLQGTYNKYGLEWSNERAMRLESYIDELGENLGEEIEDEITYNEAFTAVVKAWESLFNAFKRETGLTLEATYFDRDNDDFHGDIEEGVNFMLDFNEVFQKTPLVRKLEEITREEVGIESFSTWA